MKNVKAELTTRGSSHRTAPEFRLLAAEIVSAYVAHNPVPVPELPDFIARVHAALRQLASPAADSDPGSPVEQPSSAAIRKSVRPDGIVSFIDGKIYKTLKRHLTSRGLSPKSYRDRYGLPLDYPMVASRYAEQRSALAKAIGLGRVGAPPRTRSPGGRNAA